MESNRKIVFVNRFFAPDHSATAQILSDLTFHLVKKGLRVSVITTSGLYDHHESALGNFELFNGVEIRRVYRPRFARHQLIGRAIDYILMHFAFAVALVRVSREGDVIVAKTDPPMLSIPLIAVAYARKARLVNWLQDIFPEVAAASGARFGKALSKILAPIRDWSLNRSHLNIVVGERSKSFLMQRGIDDGKIIQIHNWCDDHLIDPACHEANVLRVAWGLEGKFIVGYSGNLGRAHECRTILDAARRLRDREDVVFLFIGGGALLPQLKRDVEENQLQALFRFEPYQPHASLPVSLTLPDVHWMSLRPEMEGLIVPSKFYGICAAGRPVIFIGDARNELAELIQQSDCGVVIRAGDDRALSEAIVGFVDDRGYVERSGANARSLLDSKFSRKLALEKWGDVIFSALNRSRAR
jgi:colanic acid biosynthesis glycosyl transferase WcaI